MIELIRTILVANMFALMPYADEAKVEQVEVEQIESMQKSSSGDLMVEATVVYTNSCYTGITQQVSVVDQEETIFLYHFAEKSDGMCALEKNYALMPTTVTFVIPKDDVKNYTYRDGLTGKVLRDKSAL